VEKKGWGHKDHMKKMGQGREPIVYGSRYRVSAGDAEVIHGEKV
jgi:hypothetical protein